jgi:hypothetical protein
MKLDFVQENEEIDDPRLKGHLTGWETVIFELEDAPDGDDRTG